MPTIPSPSQIIRCTDLANCFQSIYNFLFYILLALAFLMFLYGALQYMLSGANIYSKDEGKKRMKNSITAIVIVFIIPPLLKIINPQIFQGITISVPRVTITAPELFDPKYIYPTPEQDITAREFAERKTDEYYRRAESPTTARISCSNIKPHCDTTKKPKEWDFSYIFSEKDYYKDKPAKEQFLNQTYREQFLRYAFVIPANTDDGTEYINPALKDLIAHLDQELREKYRRNNQNPSSAYKIVIQDGYSPFDHLSRSHTIWGTALDVTVHELNGKKIDPNDRRWDDAKNLLRNIGFYVYDERFISGSQYWTGAHYHIYVCQELLNRDPCKR